MPGEVKFAMMVAAPAPALFGFLCALLLLPAVVLMSALALAGLEKLLLPLALGFSALALAFDGGGGRDGGAGTGLPTAVEVNGLDEAGLLVPRFPPPPPAWHTLFCTWYFIP